MLGVSCSLTDPPAGPGATPKSGKLHRGTECSKPVSSLCSHTRRLDLSMACPDIELGSGKRRDRRCCLRYRQCVWLCPSFFSLSISSRSCSPQLAPKDRPAERCRHPTAASPHRPNPCTADPICPCAADAAKPGGRQAARRHGRQMRQVWMHSIVRFTTSPRSPEAAKNKPRIWTMQQRGVAQDQVYQLAHRAMLMHS